MRDEHSERKKRLLIWVRIGASALVGEYVFNRQAFHDQGFRAFLRTDIWVPAFAVVMSYWILLVAQRRGITTLGIGDTTAKKPR